MMFANSFLTVLPGWGVMLSCFLCACLRARVRKMPLGVLNERRELESGVDKVHNFSLEESP